MKRLKKVLLVLIGLLVVVAFAFGIFLNTLTPTYEGIQELPELNQEVSVYYDTYGIPHIYAANEEDALRALGYAHAQDRLWQMELLRRVGTGGLSEVFGSELMLETDQFFLSLGIADATEKTVAQLDTTDEMIQLSQAYLEGVNFFVETGPTPIEFYLTGLDKTKFTIADMYNTVGYMSFSFAMALKTDPLLSQIKNKLGPAYLKDLEIDVDPKSTLIKNHPFLDATTPETTITDIVHNTLKDLPVPLFVGSNSWVIGPEKTKKGAVIFANDPHIGFSQPAVWYEAHIKTPNYEKYGYHLAGVPFPLLGHNRNLAYGLTMFENDDIDFYYEINHPSDSTKYKTGSTWETYETVSRPITDKDGSVIPFSFKKTRHGPVLNGIAKQLQGKQPVSMSWIYTQLENKMLEAFYDMSMANDLFEFQEALPKMHAPGLNVMYGDAEGNIAWWATGKLYHTADSVHTKFILDGASGKAERGSFIDFEQNPQAINPPWNYVYSANNQPDSVAGIWYPGYYLPENRAKRIKQLLEPRNDWDSKSTQAMITDVTSAVNPAVVADLFQIIDEETFPEKQQKAIQKLKRWDGSYELDSVGATIYHHWVYWYLEQTFADELGADLFEAFSTTHFHKRLIAPMIRNDSSIWWDNIATTDHVETRKEILHQALQGALVDLEEAHGNDITAWNWGKVHTLEHGHAIGQGSAPFDVLRKTFNVGPFPVEGSREVINNMAFLHNAEGRYAVGAGPSTRRIIDFSDVENSTSILPTGQSGNPLSPYYDDQAALFIAGESRKMLLNTAEIKANAAAVLTLQPKKE